MNKIYGVLTNNIIPSSSPYYRYSDIQRTSKQEELLSTLLPLTASASFIGASADFLIKFMRCSSLWDSFITVEDPVNSYKLKLVIPKSDIVDGITYTNLVKWAENTDIDSVKYPVYEHDPVVDQITSKLFSLISCQS